jgi:hypothetical protein
VIFTTSPALRVELAIPVAEVIAILLIVGAVVSLGASSDSEVLLTSGATLE